MRQRLESAALAAAGVAVVAFVLSFALGLRGEERARPAPPRDPEPRPEIIAPLNSGNPRRVEVLNASRRSGLARQATEQLREAGYDVVHYGTASDADETSSMVIDRVGDPRTARGAARVLGIDSVVTRTDSTRMVEASVILARDWQADIGAEARSRRWWQRLPAWLRPRR